MLHETLKPHLFMPQIDDMVVSQMRRLGLSQFIEVPNVEIPSVEDRSI